DIVNRLHAGVEILDEEREGDADHQADDDSDADVEYFSRPDRIFFHGGVVDNFHHLALGQSKIRFLGGDLHSENGFELEIFGERAFGFEIGAAPFGGDEVVGAGGIEAALQFVQ